MCYAQQQALAIVSAGTGAWVGGLFAGSDACWLKLKDRPPSFSDKLQPVHGTSFSDDLDESFGKAIRISKLSLSISRKH